jgi:hypothetical protein
MAKQFVPIIPLLGIIIMALWNEWTKMLSEIFMRKK